MANLPWGWNAIRQRVLVVGRNISLEAAADYVLRTEDAIPEIGV